MTLVMYGLDGADPDLVKKWKDELPNFMKVMDQGFFGELESTMPPITVPAWACMLSSKSPEYFEVTHFQKMNPKRYERDIVSSDTFRPEIILDSELDTISYLVPGTTPAYPTKGQMISGYLTGSELEFYPSNLEQPMKENTNIEIEKAKSERKKEAVEAFENSFDGFKWLIQNKEFDAAFSVFQMVDFAMHDKASEDLKEEYMAADRKLGELIDLCDEKDWDLLITSDHGSSESSKKFYINAWLRQQGYLEYADEQQSTTNNIRYKAGDILMTLGLKRIAKKGLEVYKKVFGTDPTPSGDIKENLNLSETKAFSKFASGLNATDIYVHDDRFPEGIVEDREKVAEEIKKDLEDENFIQNVYLDSDMLNKEEMPDLLVETNKSIDIGSSFYPQVFHNTDAAIHNKKGLIAGVGPSFSSKTSVKASILDVKPTIEATLGSVSTDNEGKVLEEVLKNPDYDEKIEISNLEV